MTERLLKAEDVAARLGIARGSIYNLVSQHKLPAIRVFGALRFDPDDIERLIEDGRTSKTIKPSALCEENPGFVDGDL